MALRTGRTADVELRGLHKRYGATVAVESLDLRVEAGEFVSFLGPSGCGKTTTLRAIAGLLRPDRGEVVIGGRVMNDVPVHQRGLGLVAQNYALFPHMTVAENVAFGLRMRGTQADRRARRVEEALTIVQLEGMSGRYPRELSGGQQQRVALARCLVIEPDVMLLDEPLGALDRKLRQAMQVELKLLQRKIGVTTIFVTHDQEEALTMSDRVAVMHGGRLQQLGPPQELYELPRNRFVADFVGTCNFLDCVVTGASGEGLRVRLEEGIDVDATLRRDLAIPPAGSAAVVALRPEKITVAPWGSDAASALRAQVEEVTYVGTSIHYHLRTATGKPLIVYRQNATQAPDDVTRGGNVAVSWSRGALQLLVD